MAMHSPAKDIVDLLDSTASGLSLTLGTDLFLHHAPHDIDKCATVLDTPGGTPETWYTLERPSVQILQRGNKFNYVDAYNSLNAIKNYLHKLAVTVNNSRYIVILCNGDIFSLGQDDSNRPLLSCNFILQRTNKEG